MHAVRSPDHKTRKTMKRILVVDDHPLLKVGLARLIEGEPGLEICGMACEAHEAMAQVESCKPDLVVTDLTLPGRSGLELIKDLSAIHPELPVIVFSMHDEMVYAERVLRAGGRGYVTKDSAPERLVEAIRTVLEGGVYASKSLTGHLLNSLAPRKGAAGNGSPLQRLTDRELEVFEMIGQARNHQEIAMNLGISPRTLDAHRTHIREKLGLEDGNDLTRQAIRWVEVGKIG
jgi:DNA-binding NarL/FixJ family response regulator